MFYLENFVVRGARREETFFGRVFLVLEDLLYIKEIKAILEREKRKENKNIKIINEIEKRTK